MNAPRVRPDTLIPFNLVPAVHCALPVKLAPLEPVIHMSVRLVFTVHWLDRKLALPAQSVKPVCFPNRLLVLCAQREHFRPQPTPVNVQNVKSGSFHPQPCPKSVSRVLEDGLPIQQLLRCVNNVLSDTVPMFDQNQVLVQVFACLAYVVKFNLPIGGSFACVLCNDLLLIVDSPIFFFLFSLFSFCFLPVVLQKTLNKSYDALVVNAFTVRKERTLSKRENNWSSLRMIQRNRRMRSATPVQLVPRVVAAPFYVQKMVILNQIFLGIFFGIWFHSFLVCCLFVACRFLEVVQCFYCVHTLLSSICLRGCQKNRIHRCRT